MSSGHDAKNTALLIDIENLIITANDIGLPIDLARIVDKLLEFGRVSLRRSYGDLDHAVKWNWDLKRKIRKMLVDNLIQIEDIPYSGNKNSADIKLVVDALSIAYSSREFDQFVIVSSDRDYVPLVQKLRELGKMVIGIGISPDTVNPVYVRACDSFLYYSSLFADESIEQEGEDLVQDRESTLESYVQLLCSAVSSLEEQGKQATGSQVVTIMRRQRPDYDPKLVGMNSLRDLVAVANERGLVIHEPSGGDIRIRTICRDGTAPAQIPGRPATKPEAPDIADGEALFAAYAKFFHAKMKCVIPGLDARERIYDGAIDVLANLSGLDGDPESAMDLNDLSMAIARKIDGDLGLQPSIFKILYGLYRGGAFANDPLESKPFNPRIKGLVVARPILDELFIKNCLRVLSRERTDWPIEYGALGRVLDVPETTLSGLADLTAPGLA